MINTKVINNLSKKEYELFREFADKHEGENNHDTAEEVKLNFFSKAKKIVFAKIDGELVGAANIGYRTINFDGENIYIGTIGGVVTHTDYRRMGVATKVMERVIEEMKEDKADVSLLCTDIPKLKGLYGIVGFVPLGKKYFFVDKNGEIREEKCGMMATVCSK